MTWEYDIAADEQSMDIYDHTGVVVTTVNNNGNGFLIPDDILDIMNEQLNTALTNNNTDRAIQIVGDAACEQITER